MPKKPVPHDGIEKKTPKKPAAKAKKATPTGTDGLVPAPAPKAEVVAPAKPIYAIDTWERDRQLSPEQSREWESLYASHRSKTPLTGIVMGVDSYKLEVKDGDRWVLRDILCLVVMDYRLKVIIPHNEISHEHSEPLPDYVVRNMMGATIDYVITVIDHEGECALASRRMALGFKRNRFLGGRHTIGEIDKANVLCVGPKQMLVEYSGFDLVLTMRDISYTAMADLRKEYAPGDKLDAKLMDIRDGSIAISIKEVNPNPYDGAQNRHPVGCARRAVVSGSYKGGIFCRLDDDTTVLCSYKPGAFEEEFYPEDRVIIRIDTYNDRTRQIYGKLLRKW